MSAPAPADQELLRIVTQSATTIEEVVARMNEIQSVVDRQDGLRWFNWLYLRVTDGVKNPRFADWKDPQWLVRLDVVFANLYFSAIESALKNTDSTAKSWRAMFQARRQPGIDRMQYALAGMNAHINHDLSLALLKTDAEFGITPDRNSEQHSDFESVNAILEGLLPDVLRTLAEGDIVGEIAQDTGKLGRLLAMWNVRTARDLAWDFAGHLRNLNGAAYVFALSVQDQWTGTIGRALLTL